MRLAVFPAAPLPRSLPVWFLGLVLFGGAAKGHPSRLVAPGRGRTPRPRHRRATWSGGIGPTGAADGSSTPTAGLLGDSTTTRRGSAWCSLLVDASAAAATDAAGAQHGEQLEGVAGSVREDRNGGARGESHRKHARASWRGGAVAGFLFAPRRRLPLQLPSNMKSRLRGWWHFTAPK